MARGSNGSESENIILVLNNEDANEKKKEEIEKKESCEFSVEVNDCMDENNI